MNVKDNILKRLIDENGYFVEDVFTSETNNNLIEKPIPEGLFKPRWTGSEWIEGDNDSYNENLKESLYENLKNILLQKRKDLKKIVSGIDIDTEQEEAYMLKYQIALAVKKDDNEAKSELEIEADIRGLSVEKLADLIIKKHDLWVNELKSFNQKIEVFRIKMNELINNSEFNKAKEVLREAENLGISTSYEDILNLFK